MKRIIKTSFFFYAVIALVQLTSCASNTNEKSNNQSQPDSSRSATGVYINNAILQGSDTTILDSVPRYCVEIHFISPDSLEIGDGFEDPEMLYYKKEGDRYCIPHACALGDMFFTLTHDNTLMLEDSAWNHITSNSEFKKVPENKAHQWLFDYYLNDKMIAGSYFIYSNDKATQQKVTFTTDGQVTGLGKYATYELCYAGDCANWTLTPANIIGFKSNNGSSTGYAFKIDKKNKKLTMYSIATPKKDEEGGAIMGLAFDLRQ